MKNHRLITALLGAACLVACGRLPAAASLVWSDQAGFATQMIPGQFLYTGFVDLTAGAQAAGSGYGYTVSQANGVVTIDFSGSPTGVGGVFGSGGPVLFTLSDQSTVSGSPGSSGFVGITTAVSPDTLSVREISFSATSLTSFSVGLDAVLVPEPTTLLAGALPLLPLAAGLLRFVRRNRTAQRMV